MLLLFFISEAPTGLVVLQELYISKNDGDIAYQSVWKQWNLYID